MKTINALLCALTLISTPWAHGAATAKSVSIGLSPFYGPVERDRVRKALYHFVLETVPGGTAVCIEDAWNLVSIATFEVPTRKYDSPAARAQTVPVAQALAALKTWFDHTTNLLTFSELSGTAAIKSPEWLHQISSDATSQPRAVVLIGSALYLCPTEPTFSMVDSTYPSDGHLNCTLQESVFGIVDKKNRLSNCLIHWCYLTDGRWDTELHRTAVTRFWTLLVNGQSGALATFNADLPVALSRSLKTGLSVAHQFTRNPEDTKAEMRTAKPRQIPQWLQKISETPAPAPAFSKPAPPNTPAISTNAASTVQTPARTATPPITNAVARAVVPVSAPPQKISRTVSSSPIPPPAQPNPFPIQPTDGKIGIGILWDIEGIDLDLIVQAQPGARELYYRNTRTAEGRYYHDYRNRNNHLDYEYVELEPGTDLRNVTAWVNFYKGRAVSPTGKLCLHYQGKTYVAAFSVQANQGNHGGDSYRRDVSPHWTRLNLEGLTSQAQ